MSTLLFFLTFFSGSMSSSPPSKPPRTSAASADIKDENIQKYPLTTTAELVEEKGKIAVDAKSDPIRDPRSVHYVKPKPRPPPKITGVTRARPSAPPGQAPQRSGGPYDGEVQQFHSHIGSRPLNTRKDQTPNPKS